MTTNVKEILSDGLNSVDINESALIYENHFSSGGTECWGVFLERWYGTDQNDNNLEKMIEDELRAGGWQKEGRFWYLHSLEDNTKIRLIIQTYAPETIEPYQLEYTIPLTKVEEMQNFETVYKFSSLYVPEFSCGATR